MTTTHKSIPLRSGDRLTRATMQEAHYAGRHGDGTKADVVAHWATCSELLDVIVKALEPYDIPARPYALPWTAAEKVEPAQRVLAALGLEQVGWLTCWPGMSKPTKFNRMGEVNPSAPQWRGTAVPVYRTVLGGEDSPSG